MADLERLAREHAYWSDRVKELKKLGSDALARCERLAVAWRGPAAPSNCIGAAFQACQEAQAADPFAGISFEEVYADLAAGGKVCGHCQAARTYRKERMAASRRLGNVRAALTRVGRRLAQAVNA